MIWQAIEEAKVRRVAIVGIAKHAGKTTVLNGIVECASQVGRRLGVLSIGVDGERRDAIMGVPKPEVVVPVGTLVASAGDVLASGSAGLRIVERLGIPSTLGEVYLAEVTRAGTVLLAGVRTAAQVEQVCLRMEARGAELVLVDGAFDRMMAARPELTDGVVLATGAVVGRTVQEVVRKSAFFLQRFRVPEAEPEVGRLLDVAVEREVLVAGVLKGETGGLEYEAVMLGQGSSFVANPQSDERWPGAERVRVLAVPGAVTDRLLRMLEGLPKGLTLVVPDVTHLFVSADVWRGFARRGHRVVVRRSARVIGLAVNPHSVAGYDLPRRELLEAIRAVAGDVAVFDAKE
jgi:hypothetical protein